MSKAEADSLNKLDINWLRREKVLADHCWNNRNITWTHRPSGNQSSITIHTSLTEHDGQYVELIYTSTDKWDVTKTNINYKVPVTSTPCHFGGIRYWFICPLTSNGVYCGRRVAKLYLFGKYFGCRHCHQLTYESRKLSGMWKAVGSVISLPDIDERMDKIRTRYYAGKMTKRYRRALEIQDKGLNQMALASDYLYKRRQS
jgi:hypothetical protein